MSNLKSKPSIKITMGIYNQNREREKALDEIRIYSIREILPILGCTRQTLMNYIKSGRIKAVKIGGKWRFSHDNLKKFVNGE